MHQPKDDPGLGDFVCFTRWATFRKRLTKHHASIGFRSKVPFESKVMSLVGEGDAVPVRHHGYTGQRGYHPMLAVAAGTGDVLLGHGIPDIVLVLLETELRSDFQWSARVTESPHELAVISQRVGFDNFQDTVQRPL